MKPAAMEAAGEHILEAETITREAQHDLMEIITQLRPAGTSDTSLYERIRMIADDLKRRFDVRIELNCSDPVQCNAPTEQFEIFSAAEEGTRITLSWKNQS